MLLYTYYLSDIHKKFQIASTCDTNRSYQIWNFFYNLFWIYSDNRHTQRLTDKKEILRFSEPKNLLIYQNLHFENLTPRKYFIYNTMGKINNFFKK